MQNNTEIVMENEKEFLTKLTTLIDEYPYYYKIIKNDEDGIVIEKSGKRNSNDKDVDDEYVSVPIVNINFSTVVMG